MTENNCQVYDLCTNSVHRKLSQKDKSCMDTNQLKYVQVYVPQIYKIYFLHKISRTRF